MRKKFIVLVHYKFLAVLIFVHSLKNLDCSAYLNPQTDVLDF